MRLNEVLQGIQSLVQN